MTDELCVVCASKPTVAKGRCMTCYQYRRRNGIDRPEGIARRQAELNYRSDQRRQERSIAARARRERLFMAKVERVAGHWLWTAYTMPNGYGRFGGGRHGSALAHRVAYELFVGPIPAGLTIDHLCNVRRCVRPEHLEAVTLAENIRRASQRAMDATSA